MSTFVRCSSYWGRSPQNGLGDKWTCGTTLASAYVLRHLSAVCEWEGVLIGVLPLNTGD